HIRGGSILPLHQPSLTSTAAQQTPYDLLIALNANGQASGQLYLDDGEEIDPSKSATLVEFRADPSFLLGSTLSSKFASNNFKDTKSRGVNKIVVLGVKVPSVVLANAFTRITSFTYNAQKQSLEIDLAKLNVKVTDALSISWR
ncbi:Family 31 glycoside hydrolase, partial [Globisporangium polare]